MPMGDILVFMTGQEDIEVTCGVIEGKWTVGPYVIARLTCNLS
jgi:HrpA-like RNA helicase